jgi:capsular polysaccharide biosynthesis protein
LLEYLDTSLKTDEDVVSVLALPALALVPVIRSAAERRQRRRRQVLLSITSLTTLLVSGVVAFIIWKLKLRI